MSSIGFIDNKMGDFCYVTFAVAITKPTVWEINSKVDKVEKHNVRIQSTPFSGQ